MPTVAGNIDSVTAGVWRQAENYPPGAMRLATNMVLEGNRARTRPGITLVHAIGDAPRLHHMDVHAMAKDAARTNTGVAVVVHAEPGSADSAIRIYGGAEGHYSAHFFPDNTARSTVAAGNVTIEDHVIGIVKWHYPTAGTGGDANHTLARREPANSTTLYFDKPAIPGTWNFTIKHLHYEVSTDVTFPDPAAITEQPVNMSDISPSIGTGNNERPNPRYEAEYNRRTTLEQARVLRERAAALRKLQPDEAAKTVASALRARALQVIPSFNTGNLLVIAEGPTVTYYYSRDEYNSLIHTKAAPAWVRVLNSGVGGKEDLPPYTYDGHIIRMADGLRYKYTNSGGWEEVPGDELTSGPEYWGWRSYTANLQSPIKRTFKVNMGSRNRMKVGRIIRTFQDGPRIVLVFSHGILVSTSVDNLLFGPLSRNSTSPADGWVHVQTNEIYSVSPAGNGLYFSDSSGSVFYHPYGSGATSRVYYGQASFVAAHGTWVYIVSKDGNVSRIRKGYREEHEAQELPHIRFLGGIANAAKCSHGVVVYEKVQGADTTSYLLRLWLIQETHDSAILMGPLVFPRSIVNGSTGYIMGVTDQVEQLDNGYSPPTVQNPVAFWRWGFEGDDDLPLDLQYTTPGVIGVRYFMAKNAIFRPTNAAGQTLPPWGYWSRSNPRSQGSLAIELGAPIVSYMDIYPPLSGKLQTPSEQYTVESFTIKNPDIRGFSNRISSITQSADGRASVLIYPREWKVPYGQKPPDRALTHSIKTRGLVAIRIDCPPVPGAPQVLWSVRYHYKARTWNNRAPSAWGINT